MVLSQDDVIQILKLMDQSRFEELHLEMSDLKLVVNKRGATVPIEKQEFPSSEDTGSLSAKENTIETEEENPALLNTAQTTEAQESKPIVEGDIAEQGLIPIKSPMLGNFYLAPKPGEPPFVEIGAVVEENTTVCIIEVMKLFTTINAGVHGRIKRICAEDGQLVEYDQVLFLVDSHTD